MKYKILILGGGSGGISVAARWIRSGRPGSVAVVEPSSQHYYQPLWTLAGAGIVDKRKSQRPEESLIPEGVDWIQQKALRIDAKAKTVTLSDGSRVEYEYLVIALGLRLDWHKIEGLAGNLGQNGICSIYEFDQVDRTAKMIQEFKGGRALFVMPPPPIKCAGAPQKIMYLAENIFRNNGVRAQSQISFVTAGKAVFGVPLFSDALTEIIKQKNIDILLQHRLVSVNHDKKEALFEVTDATGVSQRRTLAYDLLHVVPPMSAPALISDSELSEGLAVQEGDQKGWLAVDKFSLQHLKYPEIFGIGDVTGIPNSKTGAAIRKQAPVLVENLISVMEGQAPTQKYDGYSSCPLITEIGKVMLAEFGYDGKLMPTFPLDPTIPRRSMWILKKDLLPQLYWHGMMKGRF